MKHHLEGFGRYSSNEDWPPRDRAENLKYRQRVLDQVRDDPSQAAVFRRMCREDCLFYILSFCYIFEPRQAKTLPFIPYPFQEKALRSLVEVIGDDDLVVEKSRDMGGSWMPITVCEWIWKFFDMHTFLFLSRKEDLVDVGAGKNDPKSLFFKLDFLQQHQPKWLRPRVQRLKLHFGNLDNGSSIDGESTNEFAGIADRRFCLLVDEFSLMQNQDQIFEGTRDVTESRLFVFTPKGSSNTSAEIAHNDDFKKLTLHWSEHPGKNPGLYRVSSDGKITIIDQAWHDANPDYKCSKVPPQNPRFDFRSPWYDRQEKRASNPRRLAEQLDIDYMGSAYEFFDAREIDRLKKETVRLPFHTGELDFDNDTLRPIRFTPLNKGRLKLWTYLDEKTGEPPHDRNYTVGVDVAAGTGASNSVLVVSDCLTKEQVAEWVSPNTRPEVLAQVAVALGRWFSGSDKMAAMMIWEAQGPGRPFGDVVIAASYTPVWYRRNERSISQKLTDVPGFYATLETKLALLTEYRRAISGEHYLVRSVMQLEECRAFVYALNGGVDHQQSLTSIDPSGAKHNHGDRPTAGALSWKAMKDRSAQAKREPDEIPFGSFAWRRKLREDRRKQELAW